MLRRWCTASGRAKAGQVSRAWPRAVRGATGGVLAALAIFMFPLRNGSAAVLQASADEAQTLERLRELSIDDLANIEVTSVSRRPEKLSDAPAAVYVITAEDIHRSGAVTLPEVLRLAPNLEVARASSQGYAISARGFNSTQASNKLLVLIDGRATYAIVHSGVLWDQQQVPLDDIERIEVISGPGGTLWGANAFGGVINIITKPSAQTQGGLANFKLGPVDQNGLIQYGGRFGKTGTYRVYGQGFGSGHTDLRGDHSAGDDWHGAQTGFRTDWRSGVDTFMTEGDFYRNNDATNAHQYGGDILGHWTRQLSADSTLDVQASYDQAARVLTGTNETYESYDLQAQHTIQLGRHVVVYGGEYRLVNDRFVNHLNAFQLIPETRFVGIGDAFAQDSFALTSSLKVIFGTKLEHSTYSGFEVLPNIRLAWTVSDKTFLWAAVSRAVRTPSRIDRDLQAPGILAPATHFAAEKLIAYELGYRGRPFEQLSLSVSLYYNVYDDLRTTNFAPGPNYFYILDNGAAGTAFGMETWADWRVLPWWRLTVGLNLMHKRMHLKPGVIDAAQFQSEGFDPGYQASFRSSMDLGSRVALDFGVHAVGGLTYAPVDSYIDGDARIAWQVNDKVELSLAGYNLFSPRHIETLTPNSPIYEPRRSVYLGLLWKF